MLLLLSVPAGKLADAESMLALKDLANRLGSGNIWHEGGFPEMSGAHSAIYECRVEWGLENPTSHCAVGRGRRGGDVWCATQHTLQWNADSVCVLTVAQGGGLF